MTFHYHTIGIDIKFLPAYFKEQEEEGIIVAHVTIILIFLPMLHAAVFAWRVWILNILKYLALTLEWLKNSFKNPSREICACATKFLSLREKSLTSGECDDTFQHEYNVLRDLINSEKLNNKYFSSLLSTAISNSKVTRQRTSWEWWWGKFDAIISLLNAKSHKFMNNSCERG